MSRKSFPLFLILALGSVGVALAAPATVTLEMETAMEKTTVAADGKVTKTLVPANTVVPGDEVIYTINYINANREPVTRVVITNPLPREMTYRDGSAFGAGTQFEASVDGGQTFRAPAALRVRAADGSQRPATPADYTHLRWTLNTPVAPGQKGFVRYRAVLK